MSDSMASINTVDTERGIRVLHFVTGGFSGGATQVAVQLVRAALEDNEVGMEPLLVLNRKRRTPPGRIEELQAQGVPLRTVQAWTHRGVIEQLVAICREFGPDVLVAHGFSEHIWGRMAAVQAGVPRIVHVEHNTRERYTPRRLAQTLALVPVTNAFVGVSQGVHDTLIQMGMPADRTVAIPNGIDLTPFRRALEIPFHEREPGIVMVSRFSRQKDHDSLIRALHLLKQRGLTPTVHLAGGGGDRHRRPIERLVRKCGLQSQVIFHGIHRDVPGLLKSNRICVLSTHWEGMPLALLEGMAAGNAVVASYVPGVREVITNGVTGLLVAESDPHALADALQEVLTDVPLASQLGVNAHHQAFREHGRDRMTRRYSDLMTDLFIAPSKVSRKSRARSKGR